MKSAWLGLAWLGLAWFGKSTVRTVPNVESTDGEGGLLGLAVTPDFPDNDPWLYIFHTSATDNRLVRIRYVDGRLVLSTQQILLSGIRRKKFHDGGRLRFGPDGKLYVATGDAQSANSAQNINSLNGKILRMNPDGSVPSDRTADPSCSGIAILEDVLYIACLRGNRVYRHEINGSDLTNSQQLFVGTYGRIRTVEPSIEGDLWMTTSNNGDKDSTPNNSNEEFLRCI